MKIVSKDFDKYKNFTRLDSLTGTLKGCLESAKKAKIDNPRLISILREAVMISKSETAKAYKKFFGKALFDKETDEFNARIFVLIREYPGIKFSDIFQDVAEKIPSLAPTTHPHNYFRVVDRHLQKLRKKGLISFQHGGWHAVGY